VTATLAAAAGVAFAFDSAEWLEKRELLAREAERMRQVYSNCAAKVQNPARDVVIPVETYEDGSVKVLVQAKKAQYYLDSGLVWGENVAVRLFKRDGTPDGRIDARRCVVDRKSKSGWAEGRAAVVYDKTTFQGTGVYFSSDESYVKVFEDSYIESKDLKFGGIKP